MSLAGAAARRWSERRHFRTASDWCLGLYDHLLRRFGRNFEKRQRRIGIKALRDPLWFRLGSSDLLVIEEIFFKSEYNCVARAGLTDPRLILDLGANSGYSVRFWHHHYPEARIVAVEPDPGNARMCRANCETGSCAGKVKIVEACAGSSERRASLSRAGEEWSYAMTDCGADDTDTVKVLTIPQILSAAGESGRIDLLKCDIEGAERELFQSGRAWLSKTRYIVVELHGAYGLDQLKVDLKSADVHFEVLSIEKAGSLICLRQVDLGPVE